MHGQNNIKLVRICLPEVVVPNLINQRLSAGIATSDIPFQGIRNLHTCYSIALNVQMENDGQILDVILLLFLIDIFGWLNHKD